MDGCKQGRVAVLSPSRALPCRLAPRMTTLHTFISSSAHSGVMLAARAAIISHTMLGKDSTH